MSANELLHDFDCQCCGGCCAISGFVSLSAQEIDEIAHHLGLSPAEVRGNYTERRTVAGERMTVLLDHPGTTRCVFLDERNRCIVHPVKPGQCRSFPHEWRDIHSYRYCAALQRLRHEAPA